MLARQLEVLMFVIDEIHTMLNGTFPEQRIFLNYLRFLHPFTDGFEESAVRCHRCQDGGRRNAQAARKHCLDVLQKLSFHGRQGQARTGQTVLDRCGPTPAYVESTEAALPRGIALDNCQYWGAIV